MTQDYFSLQRLYEISQEVVADYLNHKRESKKLSKKQITDMFPPEYLHTVGHWFRKDFGGSIPLPEDWSLLSKIMDIDKNFTDCICKTGLKLQTVKNGEYKLPEDLLSVKFLDKIDQLWL